MKKSVLSAVVTSLLVPMAYAMDEGAAPAVEVEVPAVEVEVTTEAPPVDEAVIDPVAVEVVPVETVEVDADHIRTLGAPDPVPSEEFVVTEELTTEVPDGAVEKGDPVDGQVFTVGGDLVESVDENGNPIAVCYFGGVFTEAVDENGDPVPVCTLEPVEGEAVDPNLVDLASQSGAPVDENGNPVVFYSFGNAAGGELPLEAAGPVEGEVETTALDDAPIRSHDNIQPHFRGGITDRGAEALAASSTGGDSDAPNPQLLNDEQRGAVRGLRSDEEPAKPRSGMSKLLSKFRKPKSDVTLASATTTDKALSSKLAEVDRLRDTALRTGDQKLLAKADKLEKELRSKSGKATQIPTRTK